MRTLTFLVLALSLSTGVAPVLAQPPKADDQAAIQGKWTISKVEVVDASGKPDPKVNELIKDVEVLVKGNLVKLTSPKDKDPVYLTFTYDSSKNPKQVDFVEADEKGAPKNRKVGGKELQAQKFPGIYKLEGDTAIVAIGVPILEDGVRPKEFKAAFPKDFTDPKNLDIVVVVHFKKVK